MKTLLQASDVSKKKIRLSLIDQEDMKHIVCSENLGAQTITKGLFEASFSKQSMPMEKR